MQDEPMPRHPTTIRHDGSAVHRVTPTSAAWPYRERLVSRSTMRKICTHKTYICYAKRRP